MKTVTKSVGTEVVAADGSKKDVVRNFDIAVAENSDDILNLLQGSKDEVEEFLTCYNYGHDLRVRAKEKNILLSENEGPGKAIEKLAKDYIKIMASLGKTISEEAAMVKAKANYAEMANS